MDVNPILLASIWGEWLLPILLFVVGLGLVVFVHELGHFIMARKVGIKVERFAIGMGPNLYAIKRGETEYCIKAFPLGGYVKMLGQEDFKPMEEADEVDPRSFEGKSIRSRLLVVSAGVVMNVLFAALLFIIVCIVGIRFPAPVVGNVVPGYPADLAEIRWERAPEGMPEVTRGLEPGDRIRSLDGDRIGRFSHIQVSAVLAGRDEQFRMGIEREVPGGTAVGIAELGVKPTLTDRGSERLVFGLGGAQALTVGRFREGDVNTPLKPEDVIQSVAGEPVAHSWEIHDVLEAVLKRENIPTAVPVTVERKQGEGTTTETVELPLQLSLDGVLLKEGRMIRVHALDLKREEDGSERVEALLPDTETTRTYARQEVKLPRDVILSMLGMVPRLRVSSVSEGSPADEAGLQAGDVLVSYAEEANLTFERLLDINKEHKDEKTGIEVERDGRRMHLEISPESFRGEAKIGMTPELHLEASVVGGVLPDSPADRQGITPRDRIVRIVAARAPASAEEAPTTRPADTREIAHWLDVYEALRDFAGRRVTVEFEGGKRIEIEELTPALFDAEVYQARLGATGLPLAPLMGPEIKKNPFSALVWGAGETWYTIKLGYAQILALMRRTVSHKEFTGPVGITRMAIEVGRKSVIDFVYFLAILSVLIAVINFLPLPVLDGGIAAFLLVEKIRGKPLPTKVMNWIQMIGLALIILLFLLLTWRDIVRWIGSTW